MSSGAFSPARAHLHSFFFSFPLRIGLLSSQPTFIHPFLGSGFTVVIGAMSKRKAEQMAAEPAADFSRNNNSATPAHAEGGAAAAADEDTSVAEKAAPTRRGGRQATVAEIRPAQIEAQKRVATLVSSSHSGRRGVRLCIETAIWRRARTIAFRPHDSPCSRPSVFACRPSTEWIVRAGIRSRMLNLWPNERPPSDRDGQFTWRRGGVAHAPSMLSEPRVECA